MNHQKIIETWIGFIAGVFGGGTAWTLQIHVYDASLKFLVAMITAFFAGAAGIAGKYFFTWAWKRLKALKSKP